MSALAAVGGVLAVLLAQVAPAARLSISETNRSVSIEDSSGRTTRWEVRGSNFGRMGWSTDVTPDCRFAIVVMGPGEPQLRVGSSRQLQAGDVRSLKTLFAAKTGIGTPRISPGGDRIAVAVVEAVAVLDVVQGKELFRAAGESEVWDEDGNLLVYRRTKDARGEECHELTAYDKSGAVLRRWPVKCGGTIARIPASGFAGTHPRFPITDAGGNVVDTLGAEPDTKASGQIAPWPRGIACDDSAIYPAKGGGLVTVGPAPRKDCPVPPPADPSLDLIQRSVCSPERDPDPPAGVAP